MSARYVSRWEEARATLTTLLAWLEETQQWVEVTAPLEASVVAASSAVLPDEAAGTAAEPVDLWALLTAMTALRQEVKLQTRTARQDREQAAGALDQLTHTVTQLDRLREDEASRWDTAVQEAHREAIETLLDLHEALSRSGRQADHILGAVGATLRSWSALGVASHGEAGSAPSRRETRADTSCQPGLEASTPVLVAAGTSTWFRRWFGRRDRRPSGAPGPVGLPPPAVKARRAAVDAALAQITGTAASLAARLEGLAEGVQLNGQRVERALAAYGIEPIACLGKPVDTALMEVVQIVMDPAQPPGMVLDEVRRGYRRHGQVYRFAQVVATRATAQTTQESATTEAQDVPEPGSDQSDVQV